MMQLQNASQSSTEWGYNCRGNKCPASAAIDGDYDTNSVTKPCNYDGCAWWQAAMTTTTRIDHIMLHIPYFAIGWGYFDR